MRSNEEIRQEAALVLQGEDFQQYVARGESFDFWKWLMDKLNWQFPFETADATLSSINWTLVGYMVKVFWVLLVVTVVMYALYLLYMRFFGSQRQEVEEIRITDDQRQEAQQSYARLATEALQRQDYREAMHYLFLASMSLVVRDSFFHNAEYMTNREIATNSDFSRFSQPQHLRGLFNDMVYFDEPRWFGNAPASQEDYEQFASYYSVFKKQVNPHAS
jgi:hypothetical protein